MAEPDVIASRKTLRDEVLRIAGADAARCYQCGKCSAGCPMAAEMSPQPHDLMRLVARDQRTAALDNAAIWLCVTCETCTARCPNGCDPAGVIDSLRELSLKEFPQASPLRIRAFHHAFLSQIETNGRLYELGLVVQYKLRSGSLMQDATAAAGMLARGKLRARARPIAGVREVRRIFAACRQSGEVLP
ncbi:MAG: 4Fe-4S dicluster domain-containing protein [Actinobacteria bacterium]|nr:4Fe-4S dicluster domain-containing protein [Actinomycetota bacterium]